MKMIQTNIRNGAGVVAAALLLLTGSTGPVVGKGNSGGMTLGSTPSATVAPVFHTTGQTVTPVDAAKMGALAPPELTKLWRDRIEEYDPNYTMYEAYIKNGELTTGHPAVGVLLEATTAGQYFAVCTGILVDAETFLTAAHCVPNRNNSSVSYAVFLQRVGVIPLGPGGITTFCDDHDC